MIVITVTALVVGAQRHRRDLLLMPLAAEMAAVVIAVAVTAEVVERLTGVVGHLARLAGILTRYRASSSSRVRNRTGRDEISSGPQTPEIPEGAETASHARESSGALCRRLRRT